MGVAHVGHRECWGYLNVFGLELTQEAMVKDVTCAAVDVEPKDFAGSEIDLVDVFGIADFDVRFEEVVL